ncbi:camp-regulated phosphoprotein/endosulfine conserved region-domain-containing protein [Triangularia verruculosa]|uniref:mRNA stability protein n=1 Tax=Triangularia verruculosa TaxID=2587418 RepID=A0AAN6X8M0_9PEZI|nr:camp-regulated phosphoprotein/endosulfine conserved region-domain-containing protein [Triangularia verruculosa]
MNPHQAKKIDVKSLSPEEQRLFRLYGKLPSKSDHFAKHLKERKYFDSGDYAMSKAGKGDSVDTGSVGSQHPVPENIPHLSSPVSGPNGIGSILHPHHHHQHHNNSMQAGSPVKESSFLNRETSAEELEEGAPDVQSQENEQASAGAEPAAQDELPIRR